MGLFNFFKKNDKSVADADFHQLVAADDLEAVEFYLKNGHDPNAAINANVTPIMVAGLYNRTSMISLLIKYGAAINAATPSGWTALLYAADNGSLEAVSLLADKEANINARLEKGENAFTQAAFKGHIATAYFLLEKGIDIIARDAIGNDGLIVAANVGNMMLLKTILEKAGIEVNSQNTYGETPLMRAVIQGHTEAVMFLLQHGADKNIKDTFGNDALFYAKKFNRQEIEKIL